jgi:WD40 repeat protein
MGSPEDGSATFKPVDDLPPLPMPAPSTPKGRIPFQLSGYEIMAELGRGGMGVVYKARQISLDRPVALKMILSGSQVAPEERARFKTEADACAQLHHPNIVQIYEIGEQDAQPYIALEFVEGGNLAQLLGGVPADPRASAQLVETLARAMHFAHARKIIHRDLKPANVLLQMDSGSAAIANLQSAIPKITDFGLAKRLDQDAAQTRTGSIMGSPSYMAPEQASGNRTDAIGPPADVYALGAILYEMLTGRPPFRAVTLMETLKQVVNEEPVPPRRLQPGLPLDLETICLKCLAKDPHRRYASAQALAEDLQRFSAGRPILARPIGWNERALKWIKRRPALAGLLGAAALATLLSVGLVVGLYYNALLQDSLAETKKERDLKQRLVYVNQMNRAQTFWREHQVPRLLPLLDEAKSELRSFEWHYLSGLCRTDLRTYAEHQEPVTCVAFSPTENLVASGSGKSTLGTRVKGFGEVRLWDPDTGTLRHLLKGHDREVNAVAFSQDGKLLATASSDSNARIWNVETGKTIFVLKGHANAVTSIAFHPQGMSLATGSRDGTVKIWSVKSGKETRTLDPKHRAAVLSLAFSPDGKHLFSAGGDSNKAEPGEIRQWDISTGKVVAAYEGHRRAITSIAVHPDGQSFASAGDDRKIVLWNTGAQKEVRVLRGHQDRITCLAFDKTGGRLASGSSDLTVVVWDAASGEPLCSRQGHTDIIRGVAFATDGKRLLSASNDRTVKIWKADGHQEYSTLAGHADLVTDVAFSADGINLASASFDHTIRLWDVAAGKQSGVLLGHTDTVRCLAFAPPVKDGGHDWQLASGGDDGAIRFWNIATGKEVYCLKTPGQQIRALALDPAGTRLAYAGVTEGDITRPAAITLWDAREKKALGVLPGHASGISSLAFSPDGRRLVSVSTGAEGTMKIWDVAAAKEVVSIPLGNANEPRVVFSPDGRRVGVADGDLDHGTIRILDAASGKEELQLTGHMGMASAIAFSPDGQRLATTDGKLRGGGRVKLWDVVTGQEVLTLAEPDGLVRCLSFSADGRRLACGGGPLLDHGPAPRGQLIFWDCGPP